MGAPYMCHTVKYRVRIIRFIEVPIKLKKDIYQQTIIVPLFVYTYLYTYVYWISFVKEPLLLT